MCVNRGGVNKHGLFFCLQKLRYEFTVINVFLTLFFFEVDDEGC